jgi:ubiquinone/menaquinone biosynthesis C-methylase UbiE
MTISDKIWNLIAPVYRFLRDNPISGYYLKKERQAAQYLLQQLDFSELNTICDLGVGRGHSLDLFSDKYPNVIAIDKSMPMVQNTRSNYSDVQFLLGNVLNLPIKNSSLDLIICIGLAEYISDINPFLAQLRAVLKNERFLLISYSPKNILTWLRIINGHRIYARDSIEVKKYIQKNYFKIIDKKITPSQNLYLLEKK